MSKGEEERWLDEPSGHIKCDISPIFPNPETRGKISIRATVAVLLYYQSVRYLTIHDVYDYPESRSISCMGIDDKEGVTMYMYWKYVNVRFGTFVVLVLFLFE